MAIYDKKPSIYEANGDGSYTYRWDIKEVEIPAGADTEETTTNGSVRRLSCGVR